MEISLKALTQIRLDSNKVSYNLIQVFWRKKVFHTEQVGLKMWLKVVNDLS